MPNLTFWLSDEVYTGWLALSKEQQKALKASFKKAVAREVKGENHAIRAA